MFSRKLVNTSRFTMFVDLEISKLNMSSNVTIGSIKVVIKVVKVVMFIHTIPELDKSMNPTSPSC